MDAFTNFMNDFRHYMANAPQQEIDARWERINQRHLTVGPTVSEVMEMPCFFALPSLAVAKPIYGVEARGTREVWAENSLLEAA